MHYYILHKMHNSEVHFSTRYIVPALPTYTRPQHLPSPSKAEAKQASKRMVVLISDVLTYQLLYIFDSNKRKCRSITNHQQLSIFVYRILPTLSAIQVTPVSPCVRIIIYMNERTNIPRNKTKTCIL